MNEESHLQDVMQPKPENDTVSLPITFDYTVGRSESGRTRKVISWMGGIIFFILGLLILFRGSQNFFIKFLIVATMYSVVALIIRFILLQEGKLRAQYYEQIDKDYKISTEDIWGIYEIDGDEIKVAHYRNGKLGIFFSLEKDVIVGLDLDSEFKAVNDLLNKYMTDDKHYKLYTELTKEDTKALAEAVTKLGEPLSQMGIVMDVSGK